MPAHLLRRTSLTALALVGAVLLTGCGTHGKPVVSGSHSSTNGSVTGNRGDKPAPDPGYQAPQVGQCYGMTADQSRASVASGPSVPCRGAHTSVVVHVDYLPHAVTPRTPVAQRRALGQRLCVPAYRRAAGGTEADRATSLLTWTLFTPGQSQLQRGARWVRCDVLARSGSQLVALPATSPLLRSRVPEQLRVCQNAAGVDISCAQSHAYRVEAVFLAAGNGYPDAKTFTPIARARCKQLNGTFGGFWQPPSRSGWLSGDRFIRCLSVKATTPPA